jgi:hypothetical protein
LNVALVGKGEHASSKCSAWEKEHVRANPLIAGERERAPEILLVSGVSHRRELSDRKSEDFEEAVGKRKLESQTSAHVTLKPE